MEKEMYVVRDKRNGAFKVKTRGFRPTAWDRDVREAQTFETKGAAKISMYSYNINPDRGTIGAKIMLPDWVEITPIEVGLKIVD